MIIQYLKVMTNMPIGHPFRRQPAWGELPLPLLLAPIAKGRSYFCAARCRVDGWRGTIAGPVPSVPLRTVLAPFNAHGSPVTQSSCLRLLHRLSAMAAPVTQPTHY